MGQEIINIWMKSDGQSRLATPSTDVCVPMDRSEWGLN